MLRVDCCKASKEVAKLVFAAILGKRDENDRAATSEEMTPALGILSYVLVANQLAQQVLILREMGQDGTDQTGPGFGPSRRSTARSWQTNTLSSMNRPSFR